jgi:Xaa-Pro aminopeptidase
MTTPSPSASQPESLFQTDFPPQEFAARRARIFDAIGPGAVAVVQGAPPVRGFDVFRQSNEFYYCCGVEVPQAYLLLSGAKRRTTLYLPHRERRSIEGAILTAEDAETARQLTGADEVCGIESLGADLVWAATIYTPHAPAEGRMGCRDELLRSDAKVAADPWDGSAPRESLFIGRLRQLNPRAEVRNLSPVLDGLRAVKSPAEIALLRRAGGLSAMAVTEAMRITRPGLFEYQLGALAEYIYLFSGARGDGYRPIIAGGANIWHAHYFRNDCPLKDGDMVLMDTAPDLGGYTSDIGRMWPVGGTYAPWQRELYGYIVEYHKATLKRIRPGVTADQIMDEAAAEMRGVVEKTQFSKSVYAEAAGRTLAFRGHLSHPVGMAVHDVGDYKPRPLAPGVVLTVDPQMWVPEEKLYIRVEDTVAVTDDGIENFTRSAPLELDDVEALMRDRRAPPPVFAEPHGRP